MKRITIVSGARPNFVKIAPIINCLQRKSAQGVDVHFRLVHTGQHFDKQMCDMFFSELNIPYPDANLGCNSGTQVQLMATIMTEFEKELSTNPTDLVLVVGDVTSTLACSIVAKKCNVKLAHVEAGLRSFDTTMPEEINRMITDTIADYYFTTSEIANQNLRNIGVSENRIFFVGNVMIDTLLTNLNKLRPSKEFTQLGLRPQRYIVLTLHRPSNVDDKEILNDSIRQIVKSSNDMPIVFPIHPRTAKLLDATHCSASNLHVIPPQGYLEFNYLVKNAMAVITDSGGVTEETTVLGIPCLTLRDTTERPETVTIGTNILVGTNNQNIAPLMHKVFVGDWKKGSIPKLWDGNAAERIVTTLLNL